MTTTLSNFTNKVLTQDERKAIRHEQFLRYKEIEKKARLNKKAMLKFLRKLEKAYLEVGKLDQVESVRDHIRVVKER